MKYISIIFSIFLISCIPINKTDPKKYFKNNKVGKSPDYALMKYGTDYVATIHGYWDDRDACNELAEIINKDAGEIRYTCEQLNK